MSYIKISSTQADSKCAFPETVGKFIKNCMCWATNNNNTKNSSSASDSEVFDRQGILKFVESFFSFCLKI